jgi:hypothetical protein
MALMMAPLLLLRLPQLQAAFGPHLHPLLTLAHNHLRFLLSSLTRPPARSLLATLHTPCTQVLSSDEHQAVSDALAVNICPLLAALPPSARLPQLAFLARIHPSGGGGACGPWRMRLVIAQQLSAIAALLGKQGLAEALLPATLRLCEDPVAAVREAAAAQLGLMVGGLLAQAEAQQAEQQEGQGEEQEGQEEEQAPPEQEGPLEDQPEQQPAQQPEQQEQQGQQGPQPQQCPPKQAEEPGERVMHGAGSEQPRQVQEGSEPASKEAQAEEEQLDGGSAAAAAAAAAPAAEDEEDSKLVEGRPEPDAASIVAGAAELLEQQGEQQQAQQEGEQPQKQEQGKQQQEQQQQVQQEQDAADAQAVQWGATANPAAVVQQIVQHMVELQRSGGYRARQTYIAFCTALLLPKAAAAAALPLSALPATPPAGGTAHAATNSLGDTGQATVTESAAPAAAAAQQEAGAILPAPQWPQLEKAVASSGTVLGLLEGAVALAGDRVPNVRLGVARLLAALTVQQPGLAAGPTVTAALVALAADGDRDVQQAAAGRAPAVL